MNETTVPNSQLQLVSSVSSNAKLTLQLKRIPVPQPTDDEVLIRVDATPINPSDLATLIGPADISSLEITGNGENAVATLDIPNNLLRALAPRLDKALPVGNEGAGVVVAAGKNATELVGKVVGIAGGAMYSQYRTVLARNCLVMNEGTSAKDAASSFVNPLTSLSMVETMRMENHSALVHTAAASNLGQMLIKICQADNVPLVNIVRSESQVEILRNLKASHICNSSSESFMSDLVSALNATGATLAFDAIGGGKLAGQILTAMEICQSKSLKEYTPYGTSVHKQVYIYGGLDMSPTIINRSFGMCWGVGGWLLTPFIGRMGIERFVQLRKRVADEIHTTFASHYSHEISLAEALTEEAILGYNKKATGEKYLLLPNA